MFRHACNHNAQGDIGMGYAISFFTKNGYTVCLPLTDSQSFDMIVVRDGEPKKVQVKTTRYIHTSNIYRVNLQTPGKVSGIKFEKKSVDLLYILVDNGTQYLIPTHDFNVTTVLGLSKKYDKYIVS